jgi:hypothetical protein
MRLVSAFEHFHDRIALSSLSEERINRAWGRLHAFLTERYGLADVNVFIQGSYANDTAVKPADSDGEYDLDLVCLCIDQQTDAVAAIEGLSTTLAEDADLARRIEPNESGRPCVRLRYADDPEGFGFHVDIVPARGADPTAVLEVPIRGQEDWRESAPFLYTRWCQSQPELFSRLVRFLKHWRDCHTDGSIASITLQVLIANSLAASSGSDAEAVTETLIAMRDSLSLSPYSPPQILNPVLPSENLGDRWSQDDYTEFRAELDRAVSISQAALNAPDPEESHAGWIELFGIDFPATSEGIDPGGDKPPPPPDNPDPRQQAPADERYG